MRAVSIGTVNGELLDLRGKIAAVTGTYKSLGYVGLLVLVLVACFPGTARG